MADKLGKRWLHVPKDQTTLDQLIWAFEVRNRTLNRSPKTTAWYSNNLRLFRTFLEAHGYSLAIGDIGIQVVREYIMHLQTKNKYDSHPFTPAREERLTPCTIRDHVETIKALFTWLSEEGYTETNKLEMLRYPKVPKKYVEVLSDEEIRRVLSIMDQDSPAGARNTAIVLTFLDTGLRVAELVNLEMGDARIEQGHLKVGISANWLTRHCAIFGATGYGKTTLLKRFVMPLMEQGYGFAFLDPAGDAAEEMLQLVPENRIGDVVYFNPSDREYPPGLNVLQSSRQDQEMLASELMVGLKRIFRGHSEFGPRMEWITRQAIRTLLASEGEKTLRDVPRLLADDGYREEVLKTVADPDLQWFWRSRSPLTANVIDPVLSRLSAFLDRPTVRNTVSRPTSPMWDRVMPS